MLLRVALAALLLVAMVSLRGQEIVVNRFSARAAILDAALASARMPMVDINRKEVVPMASAEIVPMEAIRTPAIELNPLEPAPIPSAEISSSKNKQTKRATIVSKNSNTPAVELNRPEPAAKPSIEIALPKDSAIRNPEITSENKAIPASLEVNRVEVPAPPVEKAVAKVSTLGRPGPASASTSIAPSIRVERNASENTARQSSMAAVAVNSSPLDLPQPTIAPAQGNLVPASRDPQTPQPKSEATAAPLPTASARPLQLFNTRDENRVEHAWIDLRQTSSLNLKPQAAPNWIESLTLVPPPPTPGIGMKTVFRFRVAQPRPDFQVLHFRLFFDDKPEQRPSITVWDESGTRILQSGAIGLGVDVPSSDAMMIPMISVSTIDVEVPGDGTTVRAAYLDWMTSSEVIHPLNAEHGDLIYEPFATSRALHAPQHDSEQFGTVTATLAAEAIRIGPSVEHGAAFQFGIESQPLAALITFEVASAQIDAPPELFINGESVGAASLTLPELADPGYRGVSAPLVRQMQFQYTGWVRAQKLVPAGSLKVGTNDVIVVAGSGTPVSAIRGTQIQLKYLWDKSDYLLRP